MPSINELIAEIRKHIRDTPDITPKQIAMRMNRPLVFIRQVIADHKICVKEKVKGKGKGKKDLYKDAEYLDVLLEFREWCMHHSLAFKRGMIAAMREYMKEHPNIEGNPLDLS